MKRLNVLFSSLVVSSVVVSTLLVSHAEAAITFQGIYKLTKNKTHNGFLVLRKETVGKNVKVTTYSAFTDGVVTSAVYQSDAQMRAVSMSLTVKEKTTTTTFTGTVNGDSFVTSKTSAASDNPSVKASTSSTVKVPVGTRFPQWFGPEIMRAMKGGLRTGDLVTVAGLVPEPGIQVVDIFVGPDENIHGNTVKGVHGRPKDNILDWGMWVTNDLEIVRIGLGEIFGDLVPTMADAAMTMTYDAKALEAIFGGPVKSQHKALPMKAAAAAAPIAPAKK